MIRGTLLYKGHNGVSRTFYHGKLSARAGRKAEGLHSAPGRRYLKAVPEALDLSQPGCRGDLYFGGPAFFIHGLEFINRLTNVSIMACGGAL